MDQGVIGHCAFHPENFRVEWTVTSNGSEVQTMPVINRIAGFAEEMTDLAAAWMHARNPSLGSSAMKPRPIVVERLREFGM